MRLRLGSLLRNGFHYVPAGESKREKGGKGMAKPGKLPGSSVNSPH